MTCSWFKPRLGIMPTPPAPSPSLGGSYTWAHFHTILQVLVTSTRKWTSTYATPLKLQFRWRLLIFQAHFQRRRLQVRRKPLLRYLSGRHLRPDPQELSEVLPDDLLQLGGVDTPQDQASPLPSGRVQWPIDDCCTIQNVFAKV